MIEPDQINQMSNKTFECQSHPTGRFTLYDFVARNLTIAVNF